MTFFILIISAYLLGSISSAILISKYMKRPDPRLSGSHNPGATNMLRVAGKTSAFFTFLGDLLKGFIPVFVAKWLGISGFSLALIGLAAFLGHLFPIFFNFSGGKGVATALGVFLGLSPIIGIGAILAWLIVFSIFRYASLASLIGTLVAFVITLLMQVHYFWPVAIMTGLIIWRHWGNIQRLKTGTEGKTHF